MIEVALTAHKSCDSHNQDVHLRERFDDLEPAERVVLFVLCNCTIFKQGVLDITLLFLGEKVGVGRRAREQEERDSRERNGEEALL